MPDETRWNLERTSPLNQPRDTEYSSDKIVGFRSRARMMDEAAQYKTDVERALKYAGLPNSEAERSEEQEREYQEIIQGGRKLQNRLMLMYADQNALLRSVGLLGNQGRLSEEDQREGKRIIRLNRAEIKEEQKIVNLRNFLLEDRGFPLYRNIKLGHHSMDDQQIESANRIIGFDIPQLSAAYVRIRNDQKYLLKDEGIIMGSMRDKNMTEHIREIYSEIICMNRSQRSERLKEIREEQNTLLRMANLPDQDHVQWSTLPSDKRREFARIMALNKYDRGDKLSPDEDELSPDAYVE